MIAAASVTSGLVRAVKVLFPDALVYREAVQGMSYPHFFVHQVTVGARAERRNRFWLDYLVTIRYHDAADTETNYPGLQERLDAVSLSLLGMEHIDFDDGPVRVSDRRVEKVDGVLHWFGRVTVLAGYEELPGPLQEKLTVTVDAAE